MAREVVEMETVAAVTELVRNREHVGESRLLSERHGPLVQRAVHVFGHHHDGRADHGAKRPALPVLLHRDLAVPLWESAGVHHDVLTQRVSIAGGKRHRNPRGERNLGHETE